MMISIVIHRGHSVELKEIRTESEEGREKKREREKGMSLESYRTFHLALIG